MNNAQQHFDNHQNTDKLYFTSDGLAFFEEQNAINHANSLIDANVTEMSREEIYAELTDTMNVEWERDNEYDPLDEPDAE